MSKKTVYVLGGSDYVRLFRDAGYDVVSNPARHYDVVCFTGGTDIDPAMYSEPRNPQTQRSDYHRDAFEEQIFMDAVSTGRKIIGICRGAQLVCAMAGGSIYQHVTGHQGSHEATTYDGRKMLVTSSHHQMMNPQPLGDKYLVLLSNSNKSTTYQDGEGELDSPPVDYEAVYFPEVNAVAHQPHPEWMEKGSDYYHFFFETLEALFTSDPFQFKGGKNAGS